VSVVIALNNDDASETSIIEHSSIIITSAIIGVSSFLSKLARAGFHESNLCNRL